MSGIRTRSPEIGIREQNGVVPARDGIGSTRFAQFLVASCRSLVRRRTAADQTRKACGKIWIGYHVEGSASAILTACAVRARKGSLLIHVSEDGIVLISRSGDTQLGMVVVGSQAARQTEFFSCPMSCGRDVNRPRCGESTAPATRNGGRRGRRDFWRGPPRGGAQGNATQSGGNQLPGWDIECEAFEINCTPLESFTERMYLLETLLPGC